MSILKLGQAQVEKVEVEKPDGSKFNIEILSLTIKQARETEKKIDELTEAHKAGELSSIDYSIESMKLSCRFAASELEDLDVNHLLQISQHIQERIRSQQGTQDAQKKTS